MLGPHNLGTCIYIYSGPESTIRNRCNHNGFGKKLKDMKRWGGDTHLGYGILGGKKSGIWDMWAKKSGIWDMGKSSGIWDIWVEIINF